MPTKNVYFTDKLYAEMLKHCKGREEDVNLFIVEAVKEKVEKLDKERKK